MQVLMMAPMFIDIKNVNLFKMNFYCNVNLSIRLC